MRTMATKMSRADVTGRRQSFMEQEGAAETGEKTFA